MVKIKCKCGREFNVPSWKNRKFCSMPCSVKYRKQNPVAWTKGHTPWNKGKRGLQVSYRKGKTWSSIWGDKKSNKMKTNLRNKKYKGAISLNKDGYLRKRSPTTGKYFMIHQQVWKKNNYPRLPKGFCIHHLDNNKLNNNPQNLLLLDFGTHTRLHHTGMKHTEEAKERMRTSQLKRRYKL